MYFQKETIMGQVLHQVNSDENNENYIDLIEDLLEDIEEKVYMHEENHVWNKNGLLITDRDLSEDNTMEDTTWVFVETPHVNEFSWLVKQLDEIYLPKGPAQYRLYTTIGFLMNIYDEKYTDLSDVLKMVTIISTVYLHPDHIGYDRFIIHPITLPIFGKEF
jgi:hypothetical protein